MRLVIATGNQGKLRELGRVLAGLSLELVSQGELGLASAPETGITFVENAIEKARHVATHSGHATLADDSGLEVDVLNGRPGIYSARFAGEQASDENNNAKLIELLASYPDRSCRARFRCVIALLRHAEDPMPLICEGTWEGVIGLMPRGRHGFGYDPHFYLPALECSAADLDPKRKDELSHRGQALTALRARMGEWLS